MQKEICILEDNLVIYTKRVAELAAQGYTVLTGVRGKSPTLLTFSYQCYMVAPEEPEKASDGATDASVKEDKPQAKPKAKQTGRKSSK